MFVGFRLIHCERKAYDSSEHVLNVQTSIFLPTATHQALLAHSWFVSSEVEAVKSMTTVAEFKPDCKKSNCDTGEANVEENLFGDDEDDTPKEPAFEGDQSQFEGYEWNTAVP